MATRRTSRAARQRPTPPWLPGVCGVAGLLLGLVAVWFGLPGALLAWLLVTIGAWSAQPSELTGKKDANGYPTPANAYEARTQSRYRFWSDLKWSLIFPARSLAPGWAPYAAWFYGLWSAAVLWCLPHRSLPGSSGLVAHAGGLIDAVAGFVIVTQVAAARRRSVVAGDTSPGVRLWFLAWLGAPVKWAHRQIRRYIVDPLARLLLGREPAPDQASGQSLPARLRSVPRTVLALPGRGIKGFAANPRPTLAGIGILGCSAAAAWMCAHALASPHAASLVHQHLAHPRRHPAPASAGHHVPAPSWLPPLLAFTGVAGLLSAVPWIRHDLGPWREVVAAREEWEPRWAQILKAETPVLIAREHIGDAVVDTFLAPGSLGAAYFYSMADKITPTIGGGVRIAVLPTHEDDRPQTRHPVKFKIATWPGANIPDLASPATAEDEALLFIECAMTWVGNSVGYPTLDLDQAVRMLPAPTEVDEEPDAPEAPVDACVWATTWFGAGATLFDYAALAGSIEGTTGVHILVDWSEREATGVLYLGAIDLIAGSPESPGVTFASTGGEASLDPATVDRLTDQKGWDERNTEVLKSNVNLPIYQPATRATERLAGGQEVHQQAFATRLAVDPASFYGFAANYKTTLNGAPFLTVTGWRAPNAARAGEWHAQAFVIYWSHQHVPDDPAALAPAGGTERGNLWVLTGRISDAFKAAGLRQPSVHSVKPLTVPSSNGHIWRIGIRFYGGVTLADVRGRAERIRTALGTAWLRVQEAEDGCFLVVGTTPEKAKIRPEFVQMVTDLDWQHAFVTVGVVGNGGLAPHVLAVDRLPRNPDVEVIDFSLPAGLALSDVKDKASKLTAASRRAFFEVRPSVSGKPEEFRVLVAEKNPMPTSVPYDFEEADRLLPHGLVFATGVEGEPILFDPVENPHMLAVGATGSGKSTMIQPIIYGFLISGAETWVIDPSKGGADFMFARPYSKAFAQEAIEAAAVMKTVYAEVKRRKDLNAAYGVPSISKLPDDVRPARILVLIDEFTSLITRDTLPKLPDDATDEDVAEYEKAAAENNARIQIGTLAGRIAREARSAGVTLILGTQRLTAKMLDQVPSAQDLRTNLARVILGSTSLAERQSALRNAYDVPEISETRPGRGLYEPLVGPGSKTALMIQAWWTEQEEYAAALAQRIRPLAPEEMVDVTGGATPAALEIEEITDLGEIEWSLDDLDFSLDLGEDERGEITLDPISEAGGDWQGHQSDHVDPMPEEAQREATPYGVGGHDVTAPTPVEAVFTPPASPFADGVAIWDQIDPEPWRPADGGQFGWWEIDALLGLLAEYPEIHTVAWADARLDEMDEMGVTYREVVTDLLAERGITLDSAPAASTDAAPLHAAVPTPMASPGGGFGDFEPLPQAPARLLPDLADDPFA